MSLECVVCGTALTRQRTVGAINATSVGPYPICHAVPCRMVLGQRATMGEAAFQRHLHWRAKNDRAQRIRAGIELQRLQDLFDVQSEENARRWADFDAARPAGFTPDRFPRLTLPSGPSRSTPLAERRQRRYRDHLNQLITQAVMPTEQAAPSLPAPESASISGSSPLPGQLCGLCRGGCCTRGGDVAYLSVATLRRFMAQQPALRPRQVLAAYLGRLAHRTQAGSCINHTAQGCSLSREMRSDVCNNYLCDSQTELQGRLNDGQAILGVVVIQRRQDQWSRDLPGRDNGIAATATLTGAGITPWPESP